MKTTISRLPAALYRKDGERFTRNADNTYSMDSTAMVPPYRWTYERLIETKAFSDIKPPLAEAAR